VPSGHVVGRLPQAAAYLKRAATGVEHAAWEEGVTMPAEVVRAIVTIRVWCRQVGAPDPQPLSTIQAEVATTIPATPRRGGQWRRRT
jgi:hypothetical protein